VNKEYFSYIDKAFADIVCKIERENRQELMFLCLFLSKLSRAGHTCLSLDDLLDYARSDEDFDGDIPEIEKLRAAVKISKITGNTAINPIIEYKQKLYLNKYYFYERSVEQNIKRIFSSVCQVQIDDDFKLEYNNIFESSSGKDLQRTAALLSVFKNFTIITGGPGTGKTTTIKKIIRLYKTIHKDARIAACAPTGKAKNRLSESLEDIETFTIHKLLGINKGRVRYNKDTPLDIDMIIVDEASMIDLPLMNKLLNAVGNNTKVVMLGDKNQLSSVEIGSVFRDLCREGLLDNYSKEFVDFCSSLGDKSITASNTESILDFGVELNKSYRFNETIEALSNSVKNGDHEKTLKALKEESDHIFSEKLTSPARLRKILRDKAIKFYSLISKSSDVESDMKSFMLLSPVRRGKYGTKNINRLMEEFIIREFDPEIYKRDDELYFNGKPIIITENDYDLMLFNGDVGVVVYEDKRFGVRFEGREELVDVLLLPEHESAFCITVHKSQGSEYGAVGIIVPDRANPMMTRELLYTAITRAKNRVELYYHEHVLKGMIQNRTIRGSQLEIVD